MTMKQKDPCIAYAEKVLRQKCGFPEDYRLDSELLCKECFSYADIIEAYLQGEDDGSRHTLDIIHQSVDEMNKKFTAVENIVKPIY